MDPSMLHLPTERLAALVDADPTPLEAGHLEVCAACAREWSAYRELGRLAAATRDAGSAPLLSWDALAARLRAEGLQYPAPAAAGDGDILALDALGRPALRAPAARAIVARRWMMRAAAVLVVFTGGLVAGRVSATAVPAAAPAPPEGGVSLASDAADAADVPFESEEQALAALMDAERRYQLAASYLVSSDSATQLDNAESYRARLAALDEVAAATRRALYETPYDPVINRYYLTTLGARDATLRQLGATLEPVGMQVGRF
jgi:hypothetical protein